MMKYFLIMLMLSGCASNPQSRNDSIGRKFAEDYWAGRTYGKISAAQSDSLKSHSDTCKKYQRDLEIVLDSTLSDSIRYSVSIGCNETAMGCWASPQETDAYILLIDPDCNTKYCYCSCGWDFAYRNEDRIDTLYKTPKNEFKIKWCLRLLGHIFESDGDSKEGGTYILTKERFEVKYRWDSRKMTWVQREDYKPRI